MVLDLELEELPRAITLSERYDRVLILIRLRGHPVGQARLPVNGGRIGGTELRGALIKAAGWPLWERWLHNYLEVDPARTTTFTSPTATVAVCTRDRPEDLRRCLEGIYRLPDDGQELLVIDNCRSTDATREIVESCGGRVRYVHEDRPGLDCARNRALREARHEVLPHFSNAGMWRTSHPGAARSRCHDQ
jgi:transposase